MQKMSLQIPDLSKFRDMPFPETPLNSHATCTFTEYAMSNRTKSTVWDINFVKLGLSLGLPHTHEKLVYFFMHTGKAWGQATIAMQ